MSGKRSGRSRSGTGFYMKGTTVVELLVMLAIVVVLMTVAVPGLGSFISDVRRVAAVNELVGALNMARSEAIKRGVRVTLCKTGDPLAALPLCEAGAAWEQGWLLFVDNTHVAGNRLGVIDGTDRLLNVFAPERGMTLVTGGNYARGVAYEGDGRIRGINARGGLALGNDTFTLTSGETKSCIVINRMGRASVRKPGQTGC